MLTREQILGMNAEKRETVDVPEWGGPVLVRSVSAAQEEQWFNIVNDWNEKGICAPAGKRGSLVMMGCINEDGTPLFTEKDAAWIGGPRCSVDAIDRLFAAIQRLSGMTAEEAAEIEKKPDSPTNSSSTGSPIGGESPMWTG